MDTHKLKTLFGSLLDDRPTIICVRGHVADQIQGLETVVSGGIVKAVVGLTACMGELGKTKNIKVFIDNGNVELNHVADACDYDWLFIGLSRTAKAVINSATDLGFEIINGRYTFTNGKRKKVAMTRLDSPDCFICKIPSTTDRTVLALWSHCPNTTGWLVETLTSGGIEKLEIDTDRKYVISLFSPTPGLEKGTILVDTDGTLSGIENVSDLSFDL